MKVSANSLVRKLRDVLGIQILCASMRYSFIVYIALEQCTQEHVFCSPSDLFLQVSTCSSCSLPKTGLKCPTIPFCPSAFRFTRLLGGSIYLDTYNVLAQHRKSSPRNQLISMRTCSQSSPSLPMVCLWAALLPSVAQPTSMNGHPWSKKAKHNKAGTSHMK